ncbi:hypothetical protein AMS68_006585 [Peltaster fructicola]|uniref:Centrosomin N-terminal motif 1 domain-containing protein n=1 Tax=Peltaster fructicola TaxID=286661 RepID=A0A6H0Y2J1_9PEZI|nr:hypothetical protein AMS68_006585 [Peltaster fructicola]
MDDGSHTPTQIPPGHTRSYSSDAFADTSIGLPRASQDVDRRAIASFDRRDSQLPALPLDDHSFLHDDSLLRADHATQAHADSDDHSLDEKELGRQLMDMESSFVPDMGHYTEHEERNGQDDTYLELADPATVSRTRQASRQSLAQSQTSTQSPATAAARRTHARQFSEESIGFGKPLLHINDDTLPDEVENSLSSVGSESGNRRPIFAATRGASIQSLTSSAGSDATIGADYALQTGGARPSSSNLGSSRAGKLLDRLPSLGSVASFGSHDDNSIPSLNKSQNRPGENDPLRQNHLLRVARDFRAKHPLLSADKRPASSDGPSVTFAGDRPRRTLTLKEQNGKIDKLTKENFDLKLKIHFLDQALRSHSDEGVQELIDKNVQFQTDLANERKEMQSLRRKMREMERKAKEQADLIMQLQQKHNNDTRSESEEATLQSEMHEEILYLRQQLDHSENQLTTLREEMVTEKYEKRKMADHMRSMAGNRAEDNNGIRETMDMWQDLLNAETGRREQAEEDLRKLREELTSLRIERASPVMHRFDSRLRRGSRPVFGEDVGSEYTTGDSSVTLVEQLRSENAELRRDLGAQTSMLTSRNRERERLQQEIEDLKLLQRKGDARSVAGDSIFDRSISRAHIRAASRASNHTALTEAERDDWERKEGQLRDHNAELKLKYQELERTHNTHLQYISALEGDFQEMENELNEAGEDLKALSAERDEALHSAEDLQNEYDRLEQEAIAEVEKLEKEVQALHAHRQKTQTKLEQTSDSYRGLQGELREITQSVMNLEDEKQASLRNIETLEQQISEAEEEIARWEEKCKEYDQKNKKLEVTGESLHSEVSFLREEQEGDKIKIGELENALNAAQQTIQDEQERLRELEEAILDERQQRDVLENQSKEEVQKVLDDLNNENGRTKDELRKLRRGLSSKEVEATSWKTKMEDLEAAFRQALGDGQGTKHSMLEEIDRLQRDLETTATELDLAKMDHADKDRLLRHRDGLLESTSLESRRLSDLLDKERAARKHDLDQFERSTRGQATNLRQIAQYESRILELETGFSQDKRKMAALEQQFRDQLTERNSLLLALWNRLSTLCGADWSQSHALINGEVPSADVISRSLPAFQRNIITAIKNIEGVVGGFKSRIRSIEKEMWKDYQTLEHNLDMRIRRMDSIERAVGETQARIAEEAAKQAPERPQTSRTLSVRGSKGSEEIGKLKTEVKLLKAELKFHRQHPSAMAQQLIHQHSQMHPEHMRKMSRDSGSFKPPSPARQIVAQLLRQHSTTTERAPSPSDDAPARSQNIVLSAPQIEPSEQRWVHRLKEMERRLKAEREARLLDRKGARQRLEEGRLENEELKLMLERERLRRETDGAEDSKDVEEDAFDSPPPQGVRTSNEHDQ